MSGSLAIRAGISSLRSVEETHSPADSAAAPDLKHIFVIAGPSGSGKSTLMREFVEDRLPRAISEHLPADAKRWKRTSGNELTRKGLSAVLSTKDRTAGLVLHYDIMRAHTRGFEHYANDPAMRAVMGATAALTVLTILPSREALLEQFLARARTGEYEEWWDKREVARRVRRKLRASFFKLIGRTPRLLKEGHLVLLGIYGSDARLAHWTDRWRSFLDELSRNRDDVRLLYVMPEAAPGGELGFQPLPAGAVVSSGNGL